jgi:hypothetical protein
VIELSVGEDGDMIAGRTVSLVEPKVVSAYAQHEAPEFSVLGVCGQRVAVDHSSVPFQAVAVEENVILVEV